MTNVHPRLLFAVGAVAGVATLLGVATSSQGEGKPKDERTTRLFHIDAARQRIIGPAPHVQGFLGLRLASVTTDQPQYWPNEKVHLKVLMPGAAGQPLEVSWQKRDANRRTLEGKLDEEGVAVLALHDAAGRLEVGEYRVDVRAPKVNLQASATFSVVEGTLGAVSFAHDFRQVTSFADLSSAKGAWFLGNPGRPGMRWGNALAFRNELRVANQPYHGKVVVVSRCMLPGCNGAHAGPPQDVHVEEGLLSAVLNISGHSGPFQIEVVSPRGTVRHQFSGSSHVERDFVQVARGVSWLHRAGLAPYKDTVQVPGRQVFVESRRQGEDAFELASVIADGGEVVVKANREVRGFTAHVHAPRAGAAAFELAQPKVPATLSAGATVRIPVSGPMSLVALGGFISGAHVEGYAVVFPPAALKVAVEAPARSAPMREVPVSIQVTDALGRPVAASGVLEVFDNRVASRNPADPLGSALGDSVRNASSALSRWVDPIELEKRRRARAEEMKAADTSRSYPMVFQPAQAKPSAPPPGYARGAGIFRSKVKLSKAVPSVGPRGGPPGVPAAEDGAPSDPIREGEKKVVACERVRLGAGGRATVRVQLPPQTGRVTFRFVAVRGLEHATGRADADVAKDAYVDARLPRTFVPGAKIRLDVTAVNERKQALRLQVSGPGIQGERDIPIAAGTRKSVVVPWEAAEGTVELRLVDARGQTVDHRQMNARAALEQPVTWSRLAFGGGDAIALAPGETVVVYPNPGALLHDAVANIVTTMHSWFGHAEALSAQAAVRGAVLAAIHRGLLSDNGLEQSLRVDLDKAVRDLEEKFFDAPSGLVRPFPGMAPKPLWSAWVARNLHSAVRSLRASPRAGDVLLREATARAQKMASAIDRALAGTKPEELSGYDPSQGGAETIPVELDGVVRYRVLTDDAVQRFVADRLAPLVDPAAASAELAFARAYDELRFLRAFQRVGALQYMAESAKALWLAGQRSRREFQRLFSAVARGLVLTQEPGLLQGPAMLGGVYSSPMAMVRFLELLSMMGAKDVPAGEITAGTRRLAFQERFTADAPVTLRAPAGSIVRVDRTDRISLAAGRTATSDTAAFSKNEIRVGGESLLTIRLGEGRDPLEYYAIVAVPTTTAVKQTADILSDYKGGLLYGQQAAGGAKMQLLAVPFRGAREMKLVVEGLVPGRSPGLVAVRHLTNPGDVTTLRLRDVIVE